MSALAMELLVGLISVTVIVLSAEKVVGKMESVSKYYGISEVIIAMTIISIGTSLPEISLHVIGSMNILSDPSVTQEISATVLGTNIGSDVIQQTLIMGSVVSLAALMKGKDKMVFTREFLKRDYFPMIGAHVLLLVLAFNGGITQIEGMVLVAVFLSYLYYLYSKKEEKLLRQGDSKPSKKPRTDLLIGFLSMVLLVYFSDVFLSVVKTLIAETGISGSMIGVVTVGLVSAMPELVTALSGMREGAEGISLGTLIGSNITNPLMGVGLGASISGYAVPKPLIFWDLPMQIITAVILVTYLWNKERLGDFLAAPLEAVGLDRTAEKCRETEDGVLTALGGLMLIGLYMVYIGVRWTYFQTDF